MKSSNQIFKKEIDNSFKDIKLNSSTMADADAIVAINGMMFMRKVI